MKVVNICLNGPYTDGFTYQDNLLPKWQLRNGNEVSLIAPTTAYDSNGKTIELAEGRYIDKNGVEITRIRTRQGKPCTYRFKTYPELAELLLVDNPDVIFLHGLQFRDASTVRDFVRSHPGVRLFVDNHCDYSNSATNPLSKWLLHRLLWRHYAKELEPWVETFWGVLPARVDFLVENYGIPREKCGLLVMGADDDEVFRAAMPEVRAEIRKQYGVSDDETLVVTGGKIDLAKTQTLSLMEAVAEGKFGREVKLLVFGSVVPELKTRFQGLIESPHILYAGWMDASGSYDCFAAADLVCFPGRHSVFWEQAAAQGKPLLIRHWDGYEHIDYGGNVAYTSGDSAESLRGDLCNVMDGERLSSMCDAAKACSKEFLYSKIARRSICRSTTC